MRKYVKDPDTGKIYSRESIKGKQVFKKLSALQRERTLNSPKFQAHIEEKRAERETKEQERRTADRAEAAAAPDPEHDHEAEDEGLGLSEEQWSALSTDEKRQHLRTRGEESLWFFATEVCELGYNPDPNGPRITVDQKDLLDWLQETDASGLWRFVLTPRDTLKSTCLQAWVLWKISYNPNFRTLLYGETHDLTKRRLAVIRRIIESCETYRFVFGDLVGSKVGQPWNENAITLASRTNPAIREPNIETAGLDVVLNSKHYDAIIPDDLESEDNTSTSDGVLRVMNKIQLLLPLAGKGCHVIFCGVFWTDNDAHVQILEKYNVDVETWGAKDPKKPVRFVVFRRTIYFEEGVEKGGTPRYPHQLPPNEIEKKREGLSSDYFSCQYLMDPVPQSAAKFQREWFHELPLETWKILRKKEEPRIFIVIDQAGDPTVETGEQRDSDYVGMLAVAVTPKHDFIILEGVLQRLNPTEAVQAAVRLMKRWKPFVIGVERAGMGSMHHYLQQEFNKLRQWAAIEDLLPGGRRKYTRVMGLEPYARRHKIYWVEGCEIQTEKGNEGIEPLLNQFTRFPKMKHDDLIDPLAYLLDLIDKFMGPPDDGEEDDFELQAAALDPASAREWRQIRDKDRARQKGWMAEVV